MTTPKDWRVVETADDWMRQQEKRIMHEERRPRISKASDLLGPGIASYTVEVQDWSQETTHFNGMFHSLPGAANTPEEGVAFLGFTLMSQGGEGQQTVWSHDATDSGPVRTYTRTMRTGGTTPEFSGWELMGSGGGGGDVEFGPVAPEVVFGTDPSNGTSPLASRADHHHGNPDHDDDAHSEIHLSALDEPIEDVDMAGHRVINGGAPIEPGDLVTKLYVDTGIGGVATDDEVPDSSPTPIVTGGVGILHVRWSPVENRDPVTYEVYLSTDSGFTPTPSDLVATTEATQVTLRVDGAGNPLQYGVMDDQGFIAEPVLYYVRTRARDEDGPADAYSGVSTAASLYRAQNAEISSEYGYFGSIDADQITASTITSDLTISAMLTTGPVGTRRVTIDQSGIKLLSANGDATVSLPTTEGEPAQFTGNATMNTLTVSGGLLVNDPIAPSTTPAQTMGAGADFLLSSGQQPPGTPTATVGYDTSMNFTLPWFRSGGEPPPMGGAYRDGTNLLYDVVDMTVNKSLGQGFWSVPLAGGASTKLMGPLYTGSATYPRHIGTGGVVRIGSNYFWLTLTQESSGAPGYWTLVRSPVGSGSWDITMQVQVGTDKFDWNSACYLSTDGTNLFVARHKNSGTGTPGDVNIYRFSPTTLLYASGSQMDPSGSWTDGDLFMEGYVIHKVSDNDPLLGGAVLRHIIIGSNVASGIYQARVYAVSGTTLTRDGNYEWLVTDGRNAPLYWTGSEWRQNRFSGFADSKINVTRYTNIMWSGTGSAVLGQTWWLNQTWRATAGPYETEPSQKYQFTMKRRAQVVLASKEAIPSGSNALGFYIGTGTSEPARTSMWLQPLGTGVPAYSDTVLADTPLAYWRMGDTSGTTAADSSGNTRPGTYYNSPTLNAPPCIVGDADKAVDFDGTNDHMRIPYGTWMTATPTAFTVEAWITTDTVSGIGNIVERDTLGSRAFQLRRNGSQIELLSWQPNGAGPIGIALTPVGSVVVGQALHVVARWDTTTVKIYLNGAEVSTATPGQAGVYAGNAEMVVGASNGGSNVGPSFQFFDGRIDEVAIYGTALSATRINQHYLVGRGLVSGATPPTTTTSLTLTSVATSGTNPPASTNYPASAPADIHSQAVRSAEATKPQTYLGGDGTARIDGLVPPGCMMMWPTNSAPAGWLLCDGSTKLIADYPTLAAVLGSTFNEGSAPAAGSFKLPDFKGRLPLGYNPGATTYGDALGDSDMAATAALREQRFQHTHHHTISGQVSDPTPLQGGSGAGSPPRNAHYAGHAHGGVTGDESALVTGIAHAYMTINYIIKF